MGISIGDLLYLRFFNRKLEHRMLIVLEGQPRPAIQTSTVSGMEFQGVIQIENFNPKIYDQVYWLTGSEASQSFYCWPCLLCGEGDDSQWNVKFVNQALFLDLIASHGQTSYHAAAEQKFRTFLQSFNSNYLNRINDNLNPSCFYKVFCTNHEILKLLMETVCTVVTEDKTYCRNISSPTHISRNSCVKVISLMKHRNNTRFVCCDNAIEVLNMCPTLLDHLVDCITMVMRSAIRTEVQTSTYVSLIFGGHHTSSTKSQLSVVLRYIRKGKVQERFLGFLNILGCKSVSLIFDIIRTTLEEFQISEKFLSYSFDGSVLELSQLSDLNDLLQNAYPQSYFVPCYSQGILYTFQQSLTMHQGLTQFFEILCAMEDYFKEAAERQTILEDLVVLNSKNENRDFYLEAPFIKKIRLCSKHLVEVLKRMADRCSNVWNADVFNKIGNFIRFLEDFKMLSFLHIFSPLCESIMQLDKSLRMFSPGMEFRSVIIPSIISDFRYEKDKFYKYFSNAVQEMNRANNDKVTATNHSEYITAIDHLEKEIMLRFSNLDGLSFCSLVNFNPVNISQPNLKNFYSKLDNVPKLNFTSQQLQGELNIQRKYNILKNKNTYDLLYFFECANYDFPCTKKLLEFSLTIPFKPPKQGGDSSMFQKLKKLSYSACTEESGDASLLHAESDFLNDLQSDVFNCCVLVNFYKMDKCVRF